MASGAPESPSAQRRRAANAHFSHTVTTKDPHFPYKVEYLDKLRESLQLYEQARRLEGTQEDIVLCRKNIAVVNGRLAQAHTHRRELDLSFHYFETALTEFSASLSSSDAVSNPEWKDKTVSQLCGCLKDAHEAIGLVAEIRRSAWFSRLLNCLNNAVPLAKSVHLARFAQNLFNRGASELNEGRLQAALTEFHEANRLLLDATYLALDNDCGEEFFGEGEFEELHEDIFIHIVIVEGMVERSKGEKLLASVLALGEGARELDATWTAIDHLKSALLLSRDRLNKSEGTPKKGKVTLKFSDLYNEAASLTRLASAYWRIFNDETRAKTLSGTAFTLAASLKRNLMGDPWYDELCTLKIELQQAAWRRDEMEKERKFEQLRQEIAPELVLLKEAAGKGSHKLLEFIYKTYHPKNPEHTLQEPINSTTIKSRVFKAIAHYHPDKNAEHGDKWLLICTETVKYLNAAYEILKN